MLSIVSHCIAVGYYSFCVDLICIKGLKEVYLIILKDAKYLHIKY